MNIPQNLNDQETEEDDIVSSFENATPNEEIVDNSESDEFLKRSQTHTKKITLKNLSEKVRKLLKKEVMNKIKSSRDDQDIRVEVNQKFYHVTCFIKYLHSCFKFFVHDSKFNLSTSKSSIKSLKSLTNRDLIRELCEIVKNIVKNKI